MYKMNTVNYNGIFKKDGNMSKRLVIFRHHDLDGAGSAASILAHLQSDLYNDLEIIYYSVDYLKPIDYKIQDDEEVWFVDYSFSSEANVNYLKENINKNIVWIDHHKSSEDTIKNNPELENINGIVLNSPDVSGASLTWLYIEKLIYLNLISNYKVNAIHYNLPDGFFYVPEVIQYIADYDTFSRKLPKIDEFYYGIGTIEQNPFDSDNRNRITDIWKRLLNMNYDMVDELKEKGEIIKVYNNIQDKEYHMDMYSFEYELEGYKIICINRKGNSFMFGEKYNEYDIVCPFYFTGSKYTYSLFTKNKDIDVSKIAAKFGGGGHKGASGFSLDYNLFEK